jgi:hypothetical protein
MGYMSKLQILTSVSKEDVERIQNKKVLDITEFDEYSSIVFGYYKYWMGSTEEHYFSICYIKGLLSISLEEREMFLGKFPINYAIATELIDAMSDVKNDQQAAFDVADKYNLNGYLKTYKEIKVEDVLEVLKWEKSENVKVKTGIKFEI